MVHYLRLKGLRVQNRNTVLFGVGTIFASQNRSLDILHTLDEQWGDGHTFFGSAGPLDLDGGIVVRLVSPNLYLIFLPRAKNCLMGLGG